MKLVINSYILDMASVQIMIIPLILPYSQTWKVESACKVFTKKKERKRRRRSQSPIFPPGSITETVPHRPARLSNWKSVALRLPHNAIDKTKLKSLSTSIIHN